MIGLRGHIDQLTDNDLLAWVQDLIAGQVSESIQLDYKQQIEVGTRAKNRELAKDASSFANSCGGVLVYGVTEEDITDAGDAGPVIVPRELIGLDPTPGIRERMENIILSTIAPRLPEFRIRPIVFQDSNGKDRFLIIVYVAESWTGPHMVTIGGENRYWTRHNFQSGPVVMDEREVREGYERNLRLFGALDEYISNITEVLRFSPGRYSNLWDAGLLFLVAAPILLIPDRLDVSNLEIRTWLDSRRNNPWNPSDEHPFFKPSLGGLLFEGEDKRRGLPGYVKTRIEIHANGLVEYARGVEELVKPPTFCDCVVSLVCFVAKLCEHLGYYGPVRLLFWIENASKVTFRIVGTMERWQELTYADPLLRFHFDISGADLITEPLGAISRILNQFYRAFGEEQYPPGYIRKQYDEIASRLNLPVANQQQ